MIHLIGQVSEPHEHRAHRCRAVSAANWSTMKDMEVIDQHVECGGQRGLHGCGMVAAVMVAACGLWWLAVAWVADCCGFLWQPRWQWNAAPGYGGCVGLFSRAGGVCEGVMFFSRRKKFIERNQNNKETSRWPCHQKTKTKNKSWPPHPTWHSHGSLEIGAASHDWYLDVRTDPRSWARTWK